ncbi:kinase-like domain-containing protein [Amanita rubescens]|nr:kinase-like domain-containing protein [Amanita rubescens]
MLLDPSSHVLASLLFILNNHKLTSSTKSIVNETTTGLVCDLLSREDYVSVAEQLSQTSDVANLLDLMLQLLCDRHLSASPATTLDMNGRARRLILKIIARTPVIPQSLVVTGVSMPSERDYIGGGGFGRVFGGELQGRAVALKVLYKPNNNVAFCREALMWRSLKHKFVLPFFGIYELQSSTASQLFLVSPYMRNGTLAQWRKTANPSVSKIEKRMLEVAEGIKYIHSEGVVHGDLRGDNVLLDDSLHVQIADFGLTRLSEATNSRTGALHPNFAAPELFGFSQDNDQPFGDVPTRTQMSDVYAFGCLYYEIHYDSIPFAYRNDGQILALIFRGELPPRLDLPPLGDETWDVIQRCWMREAAKRPSMKDVLEHLTGLCKHQSHSTNTRTFCGDDVGSFNESAEDPPFTMLKPFRWSEKRTRLLPELLEGVVILGKTLPWRHQSVLKI